MKTKIRKRDIPFTCKKLMLFFHETKQSNKARNNSQNARKVKNQQGKKKNYKERERECEKEK